MTVSVFEQILVSSQAFRYRFADVVELVDTLDLGSSAAMCESSSLSVRTIIFKGRLVGILPRRRD